jgi:hypothetical protein
VLLKFAENPATIANYCDLDGNTPLVSACMEWSSASRFNTNSEPYPTDEEQWDKGAKLFSLFHFFFS